MVKLDGYRIRIAAKKKTTYSNSHHCTAGDADQFSAGNILGHSNGSCISVRECGENSQRWNEQKRSVGGGWARSRPIDLTGFLVIAVG